MTLAAETCVKGYQCYIFNLSVLVETMMSGRCSQTLYNLQSLRFNLDLLM